MKARPLLEGVLVVERDRFEGLADGLGQGGVHASAGSRQEEHAASVGARPRQVFSLFAAMGRSWATIVSRNAQSENQCIAQDRKSGKTRRRGSRGSDARPRTSTATTSRSSASCSATRACPTPNWRRASACRPRRPGGASSGSSSSGYITGYRAEIDRRRIGLGVLAFVRVDAERNTGSADPRAGRRDPRLPEVIACHYISGAGTFELQVIATDLDAFSRFVDRDPAQPAEREGHPHQLLARRGQGRAARCRSAHLKRGARRRLAASGHDCA